MDRESKIVLFSAFFERTSNPVHSAAIAFDFSNKLGNQHTKLYGGIEFTFP
jgi:hypothetical protein